MEPERGFFIVADGMGGHAAGEVASQAAVDGIEAFVEATRAISPDQTWPMPFDPTQSTNVNRLRAGFQMGNRRLADRIEASSKLQGMAMHRLLDQSQHITRVAQLPRGQHHRRVLRVATVGNESSRPPDDEKREREDEEKKALGRASHEASQPEARGS